MTTHHLSFSTVTLLKDNVVEVIANEGIEVDMQMANELKHFFKSNLKHRFFVLINRVNSYSYTFEAQQSILNIKNIHSLAFVAYSQSSAESAKLLTVFATEDIKYEIEFFSDRDSSLNWLLTKRKNFKANL